MISKETFVRTMERIDAFHNKEVALENATRAFGYGYIGGETDTLEAALVDLIREDLHDTDDWIGYFLYERYGSLDGECVFDEDNTPIDTSTWEKVYDMIVSDPECGL